MPLNVFVLHEDLNTKIIGSENLNYIDINDDFYKFCKIAHEINCDLLASIDPKGITVFNNDQREIIESMLQRLQQHSDIKQSIIEIIQKAIDLCAPHYHVYIVLLGDFADKESLIKNYGTMS